MLSACRRSGSSTPLIDDGELDEVASVLEAQGQPYTRLRGGQIPVEITAPRDLLIVTPRRVERVRRGSPPDAAPGYPLRIVAVQEDSPAMRRRLRRSGLQLLVRLPTNAEIWRLLIARALYRGHERRENFRIAVGSPVAVGEDGEIAALDTPSTILIDLSNRGCRLQTTENLSIDDAVVFSIPSTDEDRAGDGDPLTLRGRVRRLVQQIDSPLRTLAVSFDEDLPESIRIRLTAVINRWASGPNSLAVSSQIGAPAIPPCRLPSLPDLILDDETDPPIRNSSEVRVQLSAGASPDQAEPREAERMEQGVFYGQPHGEPVESGNEDQLNVGGRRFGTRAERVDDGYLVNGSKFFVSSAGAADYYATPALVVGEVSWEERTLYLSIPREASGMEFSGDWDPIGMRATVSRDMSLNDVWAPNDAEILPPGVFGQLFQRQPHIFITFSATFLGLMQAAYDYTVAYLTGRAPGVAGPRSDSSASGNALADMLFALEATRALFYRAISEQRLDPPVDCIQRARAAHVQVQRAVVDLTGEAMRVCSRINQ